MSCRSQKSHLPAQQVLHFPLTRSAPATMFPLTWLQHHQGIAPYQNLRVCCSLWNPLLPDILRLTPQCLQVCIKLSPYLWSSPWPHPAPHGISYFSYSTSFPPSHLSSSDMLYIYLLFLSSVSHIRMQASWGQGPCSIHWCVHSASNSAQHTVGAQ